MSEFGMSPEQGPSNVERVMGYAHELAAEILQNPEASLEERHSMVAKLQSSIYALLRGPENIDSLESQFTKGCQTKLCFCYGLRRGSYGR